MTRTIDDGAVIEFARDAAGLDLTTSSPKWRLGRGKTVLIESAARSSILRATVAASGNA